ISQQTGYAVSTVSLALRNDPCVKPETAQRIQQAAGELGYHPNPLVSVLMRPVRDKRTRHERIAVLSCFSESVHRNSHLDPYYRMIHEAIEERARDRGYGLDEFYLGDGTYSNARIENILEARGILGVLLCPGHDDPGEFGHYPTLSSPHLATVLVGLNAFQQNLHHAVTDYYYNIDYALQRALDGGCKRIGLVLEKSKDIITNRAWVSRYLYFQQSIPAKQRVPLLRPLTLAQLRQDVPAWYKKNRPDVILTAGLPAFHALEEAGVRMPEEVRMINLAKRDKTRLAGIDPHSELLGKLGVDLLVQLLQANQFGTPQYPQTISVKGTWVPGETFPEPESAPARP
ncbi:MAG: LacI family DNA-binding transcriptional regulator, partial [Puniceicoccales bacterium]